jgi:hypothetical protein
MHGFLNVLGATLIAIHDDDPAGVEATLGEEDRTAFAFEDEAFVVRGHRFDVAAIEHARTSGFVAYGSCSFEEPINEL